MLHKQPNKIKNLWRFGRKHTPLTVKPICRYCMQREKVIRSIHEVAKQVMPKGAKVLLFGSQVRGDAREDSDWDILILLNKNKLDNEDHDKYSYPLMELGWMID